MNAPTCALEGYTSETNSLNLVPPCCPYGGASPAVVFWLSSNPGATSSCVGGTSIGDTHLTNFNGLFYARDTAEALAMVRSGEYEAAFLMRPTPIGQVRDVAAAGENMPPKSTYFFPKLLTGLLFNPLDEA